MLLVDDDQPQVFEGDAFLKQRVGADNEGRLATANGAQRRFAFLAFHAAGKPGQGDAQSLEPAGKAAPVLLGQQFRGRHNGHLIVAGDGDRGRRRRDQRFSGPHVALNQAQHGFGAGEVAAQFLDDPALGSRRGKRELLQEPLE